MILKTFYEIPDSMIPSVNDVAEAVMKFYDDHKVKPDAAYMIPNSLNELCRHSYQNMHTLEAGKEYHVHVQTGLGLIPVKPILNSTFSSKNHFVIVVNESMSKQADDLLLGTLDETNDNR